MGKEERVELAKFFLRLAEITFAVMIVDPTFVSNSDIRISDFKTFDIVHQFMKDTIIFLF